MKILVEIREDKVAFIMELLNSFSFVKAKPLTPYKAEVLENLKNSVAELNQIKLGKKKGQLLSEFLDRL